MRIKIIFNKYNPMGYYENFGVYLDKINKELELLEEQGFVIIDVEMKEFKNEEPYAQIKYRIK